MPGQQFFFLLALTMDSPKETKGVDLEQFGSGPKYSEYEDPNAEFGGTEARKVLEKKLLWKLDLRMSILVVM